MAPTRTCVLAPLAELTGRGKFHWTDIHERAFQQMKAIITADALNAFPHYSIPFHVYTDASDFQLGSAILQKEKPLAYYSKKLTPAQKNYTTTKKELLAIVMTLTSKASLWLQDLSLYGSQESYLQDIFCTTNSPLTSLC